MRSNRLTVLLWFCGFLGVPGLAQNDQARPFIEEGGWRTWLSDILVSPGPCNLPIEDGTLSHARFIKEYAFQRPFVLRDAANNDLFRALCHKDRLLADWGHTTIRLSSANSYSYDKKDVSFRHYVEHMVKPQRLDTPANETFYFFGDNDVEEWKDVLDEYQLPPYSLPLHTHALSFGLAGPGTGVPFHFHGPGFAETLYGRKRWFLTQPDIKPDFHPNKTTLQWFREDYPRQVKEVDFLECTLRPGEAIYFPDKWWHATLNIDSSVFISTFLSP
ncbi:jmjC domain-containing protein 8-like [Tigriopus californicus]|uniref:jmjC domain-containing protein 8-like n=1 Tax=Tigriopus californicus TaxID=6832 RepID=UPI0027D9D8AA|nr:jmjC domain-containing protein 8-like [Tigriopus californicus]